jgi:hypothetical protein
MPPPEAAAGWRWFDGAGAEPKDQETAAAFARCFSTPDGARVLGTLTAMTLSRALGPEASDAALRQLEGQRRLVLTVRALAERGREGPPPLSPHCSRS